MQLSAGKIATVGKINHWCMWCLLLVLQKWIYDSMAQCNNKMLYASRANPFYFECQFVDYKEQWADDQALKNIFLETDYFAASIDLVGRFYS